MKKTRAELLAMYANTLLQLQRLAQLKQTATGATPGVVIVVVKEYK